MIPMRNNPLAQLVSALNARQNPMAMIQQMAANDPQMSQFLNMVQGKSPGQLRQIAENMARERNISINDVIRSLGINNASYK